jgi:uncharacterized protein HemX
MLMALSPWLLSQAPPGDPTAAAIRDPRTAAAAGMLIAVLLAGALVLVFVDRWRKRQFAEPDATQESAESLSSFRQMYENGELSEEEYQKVRQKMAAKIKREVLAAQPSLEQAKQTTLTNNAESNDPAKPGKFDSRNDPAAGEKPTFPES